jgi:hypothetical protein
MPDTLLGNCYYFRDDKVESKEKGVASELPLYISSSSDCGLLGAVILQCVW